MKRKVIVLLAILVLFAGVAYATTVEVSKVNSTVTVSGMVTSTPSGKQVVQGGSSTDTFVFVQDGDGSLTVDNSNLDTQLSLLLAQLRLLDTSKLDTSLQSALGYIQSILSAILAENEKTDSPLAVNVLNAASNTNATPTYVTPSTTGGWSVTGNTTSDTTLTITKAASAGHTWKPQKVLISSYAKCKWQVTINGSVVWRGIVGADAVGQIEFDLPPLAGADNQSVALVITTWDGTTTTWIDASLGGIE